MNNNMNNNMNTGAPAGQAAGNEDYLDKGELSFPCSLQQNKR